MDSCRESESEHPGPKSRPIINFLKTTGNCSESSVFGLHNSSAKC